MTTQRLHLLAGMPRSGGTLLSAILNQNPNVFASPGSTLLTAMGTVYNCYFEMPNVDYPRNTDISNMLDSLPKAMYQDYSQQVIFDKHFNWTDSLPYQIAQKHISNELKIVCPVRPVMEALASFSTLADKTPGNDHDKMIQEAVSDDIPLPDKRAKFWMENADSEIRMSIESITKLQHAGLGHTLHLVPYSELTSDPEKSLKAIYEFIEESYYEHTFTEIAQPFEFKDVYGLKGHHEVRNKIEKVSVDPATIFTQETMDKYSHLSLV